VVGLDAAGNVKAVPGRRAGAGRVGQLHRLAPQMPGDPRHLCPIGYIVLKAGSTLVGTWTFGTNNLSGVTGMTYTFVDLMGDAGASPGRVSRDEPSQGAPCFKAGALFL
jgi:hypothetical protein